ncbi:MAG TPA: HAMP domain-containing sensor histidine kinase [Micromonosporaceae bacterium]|nr:HAMP domain-containing sensor histidine kinase [Micromonosporaceae bacterium]
MGEWLRTVRGRATLAATAVVAVVLLLGAVGLVLALRAVLTREVRAAAQLRASEIATTVAADRPLTLADSEDELVQVLDPAGNVVAASPILAGRPAITGQSTVVDDDEFLVVSTSDGSGTVIVARNLDRVDESVQATSGLLALGLPLLLLVVAATVWRMVGRALAPVDAIRGQVDAISAAELHRRVPQPPGADEIARLAMTMNRMLDRLQEYRDRQRRFVSDASHELRSPVATIRQHAEVATAHPALTTVDDLAATVHAEAMRLQQLVDDLLLLAQADEHTLGRRVRQVDLDDLVFAEADRLRSTTALSVDTTAVSAARVSGDVTMLRAVLRNVTDNAARYANGRVAFRLTENDGCAVLDVDDDGPGVPPAERSRVFARFVRLDDSRTRDAGGAGLGLAIVAELLAVHGGGAVIGESPQGGARVTLRLPVQERFRRSEEGSSA